MLITRSDDGYFGLRYTLPGFFSLRLYALASLRKILIGFASTSGQPGHKPPNAHLQNAKARDLLLLLSETFNGNKPPR